MKPAAPHRRRHWRAMIALFCLPAASASAQSPARINLYRYVLDVDVPESAALIALDATSSHVLRGSAPKPIMATIFHAANGPAGSSTGGAVDIVPYFLLAVASGRSIPTAPIRSVADCCGW